MRRRRARRHAGGYVAGAAAIVAGFAYLALSQDDTVNTRYPSPAGVYNRLITTAQTLLARDSGSVFIGPATADTQKLVVTGDAKATTLTADNATITGNAAIGGAVTIGGNPIVTSISCSGTGLSCTRSGNTVTISYSASPPPPPPPPNPPPPPPPGNCSWVAQPTTQSCVPTSSCANADMNPNAPCGTSNGGATQQAVSCLTVAPCAYGNGTLATRYSESAYNGPGDCSWSVIDTSCASSCSPTTSCIALTFMGSKMDCGAACTIYGVPKNVTTYICTCR